MGRSKKEKAELFINFIQITISFIVFIIEMINIFLTGRIKNDFVLEMILLDVTFITTYIFIINLKGNIKEDNTIVLSNRLVLEKGLLNLFTDADEMLFVGISNDGILNFHNKEIIENAIENGIKFKFICINPESAVYDEIIKNKTKNTKKTTRDVINFYNNDLSDESKEKIKLYLTEINLPFSMVIKKKKGITKFIKVDFYGIDIDDKERRSIIINSKDVNNILFYENQWNNILHKSSPI